MIYFAQIDIPNGPVKIGYAKNPEKRVKKLQQHMPWKLKIIKTFPGEIKDEREIHKRLSTFYRIIDGQGREWFKAESLIFLEFLKRIQERNLTADKPMTEEQRKEYLEILMDCVGDDTQDGWKVPERKEHQDSRYGSD
jgi:hypothetical protein